MFFNKMVFYNEGDGGGNTPDPDYVAYQNEIKFKNLMKTEIENDPVFAEMHSRGIVDQIIKNVPKAKGDLELIKQLGFVELKRLDLQPKTPVETEKPAIKPPEPNFDKQQNKPLKDTPEPPSKNAEPPKIEEEKIPWTDILEGRQKFDFDKLDNVSEFNKMTLNMVLNPQLKKSIELYKR